MLLPLALLPLLAALQPAVATASSKRGLVYVSSPDSKHDDDTWTQPGSDLTWYYTYNAQTVPALARAKMQFVPMLWGASSNAKDTTFLKDVRALMKDGTNISYVLSFNEPDGTIATGGSNVPVDLAASTWIQQLEPLRKDGVKLGAPAMTGSPQGFRWLENFFKACNGGCHADFIPIHWYGNFEGLASHIGEVRNAYPNMTIWVTEYALAHANLKDSQAFYKTSAEYFDRIDYITHYSYFGSFRSSVSNVGPNAAMLTQDGMITDIGAWYLNVPAQGNVPKGAAGRSRPSYTVALLMVFVFFISSPWGV
ncbi:MAG: hypothetical protein M1816_006057 [Peltula sp. TS41687]|nr:MAG: hypothetical protein M1816_006057 [Peltula sp. TS41687]